MENDERLLTVAEVAAVLRVSKMTVYRLVERGEMPHLRVGRSVRIPSGRLREFIREGLRP